MIAVHPVNIFNVYPDMCYDLADLDATLEAAGIVDGAALVRVVRRIVVGARALPTRLEDRLRRAARKWEG